MFNPISSETDLENHMAAKPVLQKWSGGHTDTVLCLDCSTEGTVLSGGENGQSCLWSQDGKVIHNFSKREGDVTSVCFSRKNPFKFFMASGVKIVQFDMRDLKSPVWDCAYNAEEINQITLNCNEELLASCDDAGLIKIISVQEKKCKRTLRKHSNICTSVKFRSEKQWELVSGGMDACVVQWESGRGQVMRVLDMQEVTQESRQCSGYMVNPPLVHSVDVSENDRLMACGLENSCVEVFEFRGKKGIHEWVCLQGHSRGVSQVHFPRFQPSDWLLSAGNDGKIILWDIKGGAGDPRVDNVKDNLECDLQNQCQKLLINHTSKINWLSTMKTVKNDFIVVADHTEAISVYSLT